MKKVTYIKFILFAALLDLFTSLYFVSVEEKPAKRIIMDDNIVKPKIELLIKNK